MSDYTPTGNPPNQTRAVSPSIRAEFDLIATAVNSKPNLDDPNTFTAEQTFSDGIVVDGGEYTGVQDFSGASSVLVPTPTLSSQAVTKAYADSLSMATGNVSPGGTVDQYYRKASSTNYDADWADLPAAGTSLLATLTPTSSANLDSLNSFSADYDNYFIVFSGLKPSADDSLMMRFAVAGSVDSGSNYASNTSPSGGTGTTAVTRLGVTANIESTGIGVTGNLTIQNVNDTVSIKAAFGNYAGQFTTAGEHILGGLWGGYFATNAISGFRLYWSGGANFVATGSVKIYGYSKTVSTSGGVTTITTCLPVACSDETTALTTGSAKVTFRMPFAMALSEVRASLTTAQGSGSIFTVDINESGSSILSTKLTIDNGEKTSTSAATPAVISDSSLANDAEITIDIDQVGNGTAAGLKIYLIGTI